MGADRGIYDILVVWHRTTAQGTRLVGHKKVPSESTFSRAFAEFAEHRLPERVHESLIKTHLGDALIGHLSRDGTAIPARERPARAEAEASPAATEPAKKRGRPARGEARPEAKSSPLERQRQQTLAENQCNWQLA